jgi:RNA 2',3'-cyclic 3'-phosphodiesterase
MNAREGSGMIQIDRLDHLVLTVTDIGATCTFYEQVLGMRRVTFGDGRVALAFGRQKINLHQVGHEFEPKAYVPTPGSADLCFVVTGAIADVLAHLADAGVRIDDGPVARTGAIGPLAVVLIPPLDVWPPIQTIRQRHDRNVRRWMPHITLLYPFAPRRSFDDVIPALERACGSVAPFDVTLTSFDMFTHGRREATLFLAPEPAASLVALHTRLWEALPAYDDTRRHRNGFAPHLSMGQAAVADAKWVVAGLATSWRPLSFRVTHVQLIARGEPPDDVFQLVRTFDMRKQT